MFTPQEVEANYVVPFIRKELAKKLSEFFTHEKIAKALGISKALVCYYIKGKRGKGIKLSGKEKEIFEKELEKSVERIRKGKNSFLEVIRLVNFFRKKKITCSICKRYNKEIIKLCKEKVGALK